MTTQTLRNQINRRLSSLPTYVEQIPLAQIFSFFQDYGLTVVDESGSPWSGFLCGAEGRATFQVAGSKIVLYVSWFTMPSGRYELTSYVS